MSSSQHKESDAVRYESDKGQNLKDARKEVHTMKNSAIKALYIYIYNLCRLLQKYSRSILS